MTPARCFVYFPFALLMLAPALQCTCAEQHVSDVKQPHQASASDGQFQPFPSPTGPQDLKSPAMHAAETLNPANQQHKDDQSAQVPSSQSTNSSGYIASVIAPIDYNTAPLPGGNFVQPVKLSSGSEQQIETIFLERERGIDSNKRDGNNAVVANPVEGGPIQNLQQLLQPISHSFNDRFEKMLTLDRSPKESLLLSDNEKQSQKATVVGQEPADMETTLANSWLPGGSAAPATDNSNPKANDTEVLQPSLSNATSSSGRHHDGVRRRPGTVFSPSSPDSVHNYSGSELFQPSSLIPALTSDTKSSTGEDNTTRSNLEDVLLLQQHDENGSSSNTKHQSTRRRNGNRKQKSQRQRSFPLASTSSGENSTSSTFTQSTVPNVDVNVARGNEFNGQKLNQNHETGDLLAQPLLPNDTREVKAPEGVLPFTYSPDSVTNVDHFVARPPSNQLGAHSQLTAISNENHFPHPWMHQFGQEAILLSHAADNYTDTNDTQPIKPSTVQQVQAQQPMLHEQQQQQPEPFFPLFHTIGGAAMDPHGFVEHPIQQLPPNQIAGVGHSNGNTRDQMVGPQFNPMYQHVGDPLLHSPPDFLIPSDRLPHPAMPPMSGLSPSIIHPGSSGQQIDDIATVTGISSSSTTIQPTKSLDLGFAGRNNGNDVSGFMSTSSINGTVSTVTAATVVPGHISTVAPSDNEEKKLSNISPRLDNTTLSAIESQVSTISTVSSTTGTPPKPHQATPSAAQTTHGSTDKGVRQTEGQQVRRLHQRSSATKQTRLSVLSMLLMLICPLISGHLRFK